MDLKALIIRRDKLKADKEALLRATLDAIRPKVEKMDNDLRNLDFEINDIVSTKAKIARKEKRKDFGVIDLFIDGVTIKHDIPKSVNWDQEQLAGVYEQIHEGGDNPAEYIKIEYKVEEKKFQAWPEKIKAIFKPARTEKPGKAKIYKIIITEP